MLSDPLSELIEMIDARGWAVRHVPSEGWRAFDGGGMHDPNGVTGGYFDHLCFTAYGN